jgi:hypothetical protein
MKGSLGQGNGVSSAYVDSGACGARIAALEGALAEARRTIEYVHESLSIDSPNPDNIDHILKAIESVLARPDGTAAARVIAAAVYYNEAVWTKGSNDVMAASISLCIAVKDYMESRS